MRRVAVVASVAALLPLSHVQAQTPSDSSGLVKFDLSTNELTFGSSPATASQAGQATAPRGFFIKALAGAWLGDGEGVLVGVGASFLPFTIEQHELGANVSYLHIDESDGFMIEGNYSYNFRPQEVAFTPYVTAGFNIFHVGFESDCDGSRTSFLSTSTAAARRVCRWGAVSRDGLATGWMSSARSCSFSSMDNQSSSAAASPSKVPNAVAWPACRSRSRMARTRIVLDRAQSTVVMSAAWS